MTLDDLLTAIVRGDALSPEAWRGVEADSFCAAADRHGVLPLVAERVRRGDTRAPAALAARVSDLAQANVAIDLEQEAELQTVLAALDEAGVQPLVFKGAHLAHRDYARSDLRPRVDSDVLIPADAGARAAAHQALTTLGYETAPHVGGDFVMTQRMYVKRGAARVRHAVDLHWRIATPQAFARMLSHDEMLREAEALPRLAPAARGPSGPHALMIACAHRVAHHAGSDCLIWHQDIDRIARRLTPTEWDHFVRLAGARQVRAVCDVSLSRAVQRFRTPVPGSVFEALRAPGGAPEPSARYFTPPRNSLAAAMGDLRALSSWKDRARFIREHLLPPSDYMREVYAPGSHAPVAWLYVRRLSKGVRPWRRRNGG